VERITLNLWQQDQDLQRSSCRYIVSKQNAIRRLTKQPIKLSIKLSVTPVEGLES